MFKKTIFISFILTAWSVIFASEDAVENWQNSILGGLNMTQNGYDNWTAGGEGSFAWQLNLKYSFIRDFEKTNWATKGKFAYGENKTGSGDTHKSIDEIKAESVITLKHGTKINPFLAITGETQFANGYNYSVDPQVPISAFMDPAYFRESLGMGLAVREGISTRMGLSFKQTLTSKYPVPYTDNSSTLEIETVKSEVGAESVTDISLPISETSSFTSKLELFSAFNSVNAIDVDFDNTLLVKITEYINVNINFKVVYDRDISAKRQIKESMSLGMNYTFI